MPHEKFLWPICRKVAQSTSLTDRMIARLDVDELALIRHDKGELLAEIQRVCFECPHGDQCRQWLSGDDISLAEPEFCPNLRRLSDFRRILATATCTEALPNIPTTDIGPMRCTRKLGKQRQKDC